MAESENLAETAYNMLHFPAEIIERILCEACLGFVDLANISQVCSCLQEICSSNEVWKSKLQQRWSRLLDRYDRRQNCIWKEECMNSRLFGNKVREMVKGLSPIYIHAIQEDISNEGFSEFGALLSQHEHAADFVIDALMEIMKGGDGRQNLTIKYYAEKVLPFVQQRFLSQKITEFLQLPSDKQRLETGAVMIACWCQPLEHITENCIADKLDRLAGEVRDELKGRHPHHPVLTTRVNMEDVQTDLWSCEQCEAILDAINTVLFEHHRFIGSTHQYYDKANSFIDKVLEMKTGIPITLSIVYSAIARRLGVVCEPVNFPSHFVLKWKQRPLASEEQQYTYIDAFHGGKFHSLDTLTRELNIPYEAVEPETFNVTTTKEVLERMTRNLVAIGQQRDDFNGMDNMRSHSTTLDLAVLIMPDELKTRLQHASIHLNMNVNLPEVLERMTRNLVAIGQQRDDFNGMDNMRSHSTTLDLAVLIMPDELKTRLQHASIHLNMNVNLPEVIDGLQRMVDAADQSQMGMVAYVLSAVQAVEVKNREIKKQKEKKHIPKRRQSPKEVKYCIGLVMKHKRYDYMCVISGWDARCKASEEWIVQMGVNTLPNQDKQPFYNVLVTDGSKRYAAEENLELHENPEAIRHTQVGRYFQEFCGTHYLPNVELAALYPDDGEMLQQLVREFYQV